LTRILIVKAVVLELKPVRFVKQNYPLYGAVLGSVALLGGAYAFQYWGGLMPCELCYWQRYPHWIVIALGLLSLFVKAPKTIGLVVSLVLLSAAGLTFYHVGVEYRWWSGPGGCTAALPDFTSTQQMMQAIIMRPVVRCDEPAWSLFGLSMAVYHGIIAASLALWLGSSTLYRHKLSKRAGD
jgi:disulfide bond formation protein DsbB